MSVMKIEDPFSLTPYVCILSVKECWHLVGKDGGVPHIEASFVLTYTLNIFIVAFLLASNSELLDDLEIPALKIC